MSPSEEQEQRQQQETANLSGAPVHGSLASWPEWTAVGVLVVLWSFSVQWSSRSVGLYYDDFLVFRHYRATVVIQAWWHDLADLTSPELWVHAYRPLTLAVHALTFEVCGFDPNHLLVARALMDVGLGLLMFAFVKAINGSSTSAAFCALLYLVFPANFYALTWNTEIAAVSTVGWLLLALIGAVLYVRSGYRTQYALLCGSWAAALLTKEIALPFIAVFPIIWVLYGRCPKLRSCFTFVWPLALISLVYLGIRLMVLHGSWGAQGITPDQPHFVPTAARNYAIFFAWMSYLLPIHLVADDQPSIVRWLSLVIVVFPVAVGVLEALANGLAPRLKATVTDVRAWPSSRRQMLLGVSIGLIGGSICCLYAEPRVMIAAAVGPVLALGIFPDILTRVGSLRLQATAIVCAIVVAANAFVYWDLVHRPNADFVRLRGLVGVESYYELGNLYEEWGLRQQAAALRGELVSEHLTDPQTGKLQIGTFREYLRSIGFSDLEASDELRQVQAQRGAFER